MNSLDKAIIFNPQLGSFYIKVKFNDTNLNPIL